MASCKDCLHYEACESQVPKTFWDSETFYYHCKCFKDRNKFVELPCKVGDRVYQTDGIRIYENKIERIIFGTNNIGFDKRLIGKSIFLTREEAEKALKESANNDTKRI